MLKQLVDHVVKQLVDKPEFVAVEVFHEGPQVIVQIKIPVDDFKRVIGKEGRVIKAIRTMVCALNPSDKHVVVDIIK